MQKPQDSHWNASKRVLRYIQGIKDFGLLYTKTKKFVLGGYSDADFAGSIDDPTSTSGYLMNMGSAADLGIAQAEATPLFIDSQSAIKLVKNPIFHSKTKHVDTKYHHIRSLIAKDVFKPVYCPSKDQISDIFTKTLGRIKFTECRDELYIYCNVSLDHGGNVR
eukprot:PITA_23636